MYLVSVRWINLHGSESAIDSCLLSIASKLEIYLPIPYIQLLVSLSGYLSSNRCSYSPLVQHTIRLRGNPTERSSDSSVSTSFPVLTLVSPKSHPGFSRYSGDGESDWGGRKAHLNPSR